MSNAHGERLRVVSLRKPGGSFQPKVSVAAGDPARWGSRAFDSPRSIVSGWRHWKKRVKCASASSPKSTPMRPGCWRGGARRTVDAHLAPSSPKLGSQCRLARHSKRRSGLVSANPDDLVTHRIRRLIPDPRPNINTRLSVHRADILSTGTRGIYDTLPRPTFWQSNKNWYGPTPAVTVDVTVALPPETTPVV